MTNLFIITTVLFLCHVEFLLPSIIGRRVLKNRRRSTWYHVVITDRLVPEVSSEELKKVNKGEAQYFSQVKIYKTGGASWNCDIWLILHFATRLIDKNIW